MAFVAVCKTGAVREGGMQFFRVGKKSVILVWPKDGELKAYRGRCPHADALLDEATFDGERLLCTIHNWHFDATSGQCLGPKPCALSPFEIRVDGDDVLVDVGGKAA